MNRQDKYSQSLHRAQFARILGVAAYATLSLFSPGSHAQEFNCTDLPKVDECKAGAPDGPCAEAILDLAQLRSVSNTNNEVQDRLKKLKIVGPAFERAQTAAHLANVEAKAFDEIFTEAKNKRGDRTLAMRVGNAFCILTPHVKEAQKALSDAEKVSKFEATVSSCEDGAGPHPKCAADLLEASKGPTVALDLANRLAVARKEVGKLKNDALAVVRNEARKIDATLGSVDVAKAQADLAEAAKANDEGAARAAYGKLLRVESVFSLVDALKAKRGAIDAICVDECKAPANFCIDASSSAPLCEGKKPDVYALPDSIKPKDRITVKVIGFRAQSEKVSLTIDSIRATDRLFAKEAGERGGGERAEEARLEVIKELSVDAADDTAISALRIRYQLADGENAIDRSYTLLIDHGKYYLEFGALFPLVIGGSRKIVQTPLPGTGERRLTVDEDWSVNPAIVMNVFPGGRRRGIISSCQDRCRVGDMLGLQGGVDLDFGKPFDRIFLGGVLQPIAGVSFDTGVAFVQQEYLPSGHAENMILGSGESFTPALRYTPRLYFGVTLTLDIINTAATATRGFANALSF